MLVFDPKTKGISPSGGVKKSLKKDKSERAKFSATKKTAKAGPGKDTAEVANVGQMLFLQEVDDRQQDQDSLEEFAQKAFKQLKELQIAIMQDKVSEKNLYNLQYVLANNDHKFITPELKNLSNEIATRIAVEIAKIEVAMENNNDS